MKWITGILNPYKMYIIVGFGVALIIGVLSLVLYINSIKADLKDSLVKVGSLETANKSLVVSVKTLQNQVDEINNTLKQRAEEQEKIEGIKNETVKQNRIILSKPENAKVADIKLPNDMLDKLRNR